METLEIQYTDKVADDSTVIQRQISPRTTETKAPEHQWDDRSGGDSRIEISTLAKDQKSLHIASKKETIADDTSNSNSLTHSPSQSWSKETESSGFEESVSNLTNEQDSAKMPEMWITTVNAGRRSTVMELASETTVVTSCLNTMGTKRKNTGSGKDNHVDVVETNQPSETVSAMSAIDSGDADESMNMVKPGTEAWRLTHSRYVQNTTEMISGSFLHDRADEHNQLPDESNEQKHSEDLAGIQAHHHERWTLCLLLLTPSEHE